MVIWEEGRNFLWLIWCFFVLVRFVFYVFIYDAGLYYDAYIGFGVIFIG